MPVDINKDILSSRMSESSCSPPKEWCSLVIFTMCFHSMYSVRDDVRELIKLFSIRRLLVLSQ